MVFRVSACVARDTAALQSMAQPDTHISLENVLGSDAVAAVGYQSTREASGIELPESRMIVVLSAGITDNTSVAFEWRRDEDYGGDSTDLATAQFTVEFQAMAGEAQQ